MKITKFQKWILRKIFRDIVTQGPHHENNIIEVYTLLREEADREFNEDNIPTRNSFLTECFEKSLIREEYYSELIGEET